MAEPLSLPQALELHQAGDLTKAEAAYLALLKQQPDNADLLHLLGILYSQIQAYDVALPYLEKALALDPNAATYHNSMGNVQKKLQHPEQAITHYQRALELAPNSTAAHNNLASIYLSQGDAPKAIEHYQAALKLEPNFVDSHYNLALSYLKQDDPESAKTELERCLELDHNHAFALATLGKLTLQNNQYAQAADYLNRSVQLYPNNEDALANLGAAEVKLGEFDTAIRHFEQALKLDPYHFEAQYNLGCTYLSIHNPKKALQLFLQLLRGPENPDVYYNIGVIYMYQDHFSEAISYLQQCLRFAPDYLEAHINLGVTFLKMNKPTKAIEHFEKALELDPKNAEVRYILSALRGDATPRKAPESYVQHLFDQYAPHYESHLKEFLHYETPQHLLEVVKAALAEKLHQLTILDLGCGTGLTGEVFKPFANRLIGVDLSPKMVEAAAKKALYDDLHICDINVTLSKERDIDLILAGDVLSYLGDLSEIFAGVHQALKPGGYFAFSIERLQDDTREYHLETTARYTHSRRYIDRLAKTHHLHLAQEALVPLRQQHNQPVQGWILVFQKG